MITEEQIIHYMRTKHYKEPDYICWDFVMDVYKDLYDFELPEYPVGEVQAEFKNRLKENFPHDIVRSEEAQDGDIVVFSIFANQHAGIMIDSDNFIHLSKLGVEITKLNSLPSNNVIYRIKDEY